MTAHPAEERRVDLPYALIADTHVQRAATCLELIEPFKLGVLVARDGLEASRVVDRFGPPVLLVIDLALPGKDGFAVIEGLRNEERDRSQIIAWSAFRDVRAFAAQRLAGLNVRVLSAGASKAVIHGAIQRALDQYAATASARVDEAAPSEAQLNQTMSDLAERARRVSRTPGVAVYLKAPGAAQFRAAITWTSAGLVPHSPYHLPRVFGWIQESGEAVVLPDLGTQPLSDLPTATLQDVVKGLIAVPITGPSGEMLGALSVFDVKPLTLSDVEVDALKVLGRSIPFAKPQGAPAAPRAASPEVADHVAGAHSGPVGASADVRRSRFAPDAAPSPLVDRTSGEFAAARELARARREDRPLSIVLFDLSSHAPESSQRGAADLPGIVGEALVMAIRQSDLPIHWGATELIVVLPGLSTVEARPVAERVRAALHAASRRRLAVAGGVAQLAATDRTFGDLVLRAREKVRLALEFGHNRVA